jgi:hypothetical protein
MMEKHLNVNININVAREMLMVAGFSQVAVHGSDEDVFNAVLNRISCYGATWTELTENRRTNSTFNVRDCMAPGGGNK